MLKFYLGPRIFAKIREYIRICEVDTSESSRADFSIMQMIVTVPVLLEIYSTLTIWFCATVFLGAHKPNASK